MADIFISYKREDRDWAERLSRALEVHGWSVWWDTRLIAGEMYDDVIEEELDKAGCVLVLWSKESVESRWVRSEATAGLRRKVLVPVLIEEVEQPLAFILIHAANLTGWDGKHTDARFKELVEDISTILGSPRIEHPTVDRKKEHKEQTPQPARRNKVPLILGTVVLLAALSIGLMSVLNRSSPPVGEATIEEAEATIAEVETAARPEVTQSSGEASEPSREAPDNSSSRIRNGIGMVFVPIKADRFVMGSERGEANEQPIHRVQISSGFYMGETEVTQEQWEKVMGDKPSRYAIGPNYPVESVSWNRVQEFLEIINNTDRAYQYRLPTEAEWEFACRAGSTTEFYHGNDRIELQNYAVYENSYRSGASPVKSKRPNAWGLYDMMGNVSEWTSDWYDASYYQNSPAVDPQGPRGRYKVFRGGSYHSKNVEVRCAKRDQNLPTHHSFNVGFRLVAVPKG